MSLLQKNTWFCASLILLSGCANYHAAPLSAISSIAAVKASDDSKVSAAWKIYDKKDCKTYLGRDLIAEGYIPVQLTIRNQSEDPLYISSEQFNIPLSSPSRVARTVHTSTAKRVTAWGIGSLLITPLIIPAIYDGFRSSEANRSLDEDYLSKTLHQHTIQPHTMYDTVIFVTKDQIEHTIEMFLRNERTAERITFPIVKDGHVCCG